MNDTTDPADHGALIVLEGIDGSGTTTQAALLASALGARGHRAHLTRQPSTGPIGKLVREMLRGEHKLPDGEAPGADTMALLFAADRHDHIQREVIPELDAGSLVICARWSASALVYQIAGLPFDEADDRAMWVSAMQDDTLPDLTIYLRVRPDIAAERRRAAGMRNDLYDNHQTQVAVYEAYEMLIADNQDVLVIDGEQPIGDVTAAILAAVTSRIGKR